MSESKSNYYEMDLDELVGELHRRDEIEKRLQTKLKVCISGLIQIQKTKPEDPSDAYGTVQAIHFIASKTLTDIIDEVVNQPKNQEEKQ